MHSLGAGPDKSVSPGPQNRALSMRSGLLARVSKAAGAGLRMLSADPENVGFAGVGLRCFAGVGLGFARYGCFFLFLFDVLIAGLRLRSVSGSRLAVALANRFVGLDFVLFRSAAAQRSPPEKGLARTDCPAVPSGWMAVSLRRADSRDTLR